MPLFKLQDVIFPKTPEGYDGPPFPSGMRGTEYEKVYDDCSMKFMCTNDMYIRKMFDKWFDIIYNPTTNRFGLKDDYSVDVVIQMLNKQDIPVYGGKLLKAFPVKISGFDLTQDKEALVEVQIDWKYDKFETEGILSSSLSAANAVIDLLT